MGKRYSVAKRAIRYAGDSYRSRYTDKFALRRAKMKNLNIKTILTIAIAIFLFSAAYHGGKASVNYLVDMYMWRGAILVR